MKLSSLFASHMVFAANKPIRVFGEGQGRVCIRFAGLAAETVSEGKNWLLELPPLPAGGPYEMEIDLDGTSIVLQDVRIGAVYLFAGQSNMQFKMKESATAREEYRGDERLRMFVSHRVTEDERFTPADGWIVAAEDNVSDWSAIGYLTASRLVRDGEAVGVVGCYQGASVIESWMPEGTCQKLGIEIADEDKHIDHFKVPFADWNGEGVLFDKTLSPLFPFSFSGVVWYQGESNATPAEGAVYLKMLAALIDIWRERFMDAELPFVVVQIADCLSRRGEGWSRVQQAQLEIADVQSGVVTVISKDVCENDNIHPPTKDKLSRRIAAVLQRSYGR